MGTARGEQSSGVSSVAVVAVVIIVIISVAYSYAFLTSTPAVTPKATSVRVFGLVAATGGGVHPTQIVFTDSKGGQAITAAVSGSGYSVQLPNHRMYKVSMAWGGNYTWQVSREELGQLMVDMAEGSMMSQSYNVVQPTPDSEVTVTGTLSWQINTSHPTAIKFAAPNGQTFQTAVTGMSFTIKLPNMAMYEVNVAGTNATGHIEWYYYHQLKVNAGVNVVGLTVKLG